MASPELTNPRAERVRSVRRLATRAFRQEQRRFLVEGAHSVREALVSVAAGQAVVHEVFVTEAAALGHPELLSLANAAHVPVHTATEPVLAALSETVTPQGLVAVCDFLDRPLANVLATSPRLAALLAEVRDPGNAGSVLRLADAAGAGAVVFSSGTVDPYNGKVVRASVGGLFHIPIVTDVPVLDSIVQLRKAGLQVFAADGQGALDLDEAASAGMLTHPTVWLFGNEAWGLPQELLAAADQLVRIPIYGRAESLNLATAAALCLYASARSQRSVR